MLANHPHCYRPCPRCGHTGFREPRLEVDKRPSVKQVIEDVARKHGIRTSDIIGARLSRRYVVPRHLAIWLVYHLRPDLSTPEIGRHFGGRDHTTVLYVAQKLGSLDDPVALWREISSRG